jgi:multiple sugar transport system substrate-binding protein
MTKNVLRRWAPGIAVFAAAALGLSACGSGGSSGSDSGKGAGGAAAVKSALAQGGDITVWAWEPTLKQVVTGFQAKYPKVHVHLVNAGTGNDQYTALQNAVQAGKGVPDVAQIEYFALSQFALGKSVTDLSAYGAKDLATTYSPGPWNSVNIDGGIYGLPMDSGPMALFYNKKVFDTYKLPVPTTWQQYLDDARKLHQADPKAYITSDTGDAGMATSLIWQAGGKPYKVDGTKVSVDFTGDAGTAAYTKVWQQLVSEHLVAPVTGWSDQWYKGLGDGTIATLATGAWMPANFSSGVKKSAGDWRVAPLPQWQAGATASAENGGSSLAVMKTGKNAKSKELAYGFLQYANQGAGVQARIKGGAFPATTADLDSTAFLNTRFPYFGGQQANRIFSQSAKDVLPGWSYLPYQVYANSVFNDTVGKAYVSGTTLSSGLKDWQQKSIDYGKQQGFSVG